MDETTLFSPIIPQGAASLGSEAHNLESCPTCPSCGSTRINLVRMPSYSIHHAARRCGNCDRFLSWELKPEKQGKRQQQQQTIDQLLKSPHLSHWKREFLEGVKGKRSLSPKQAEILNQIESRLGGVA